MSGTVHALEPGSVEDVMMRLRALHDAGGLDFIAAVTLTKDNRFVAFQGGHCTTINAVGMLEALKLRVALDALDVDGD